MIVLFIIISILLLIILLYNPRKNITPIVKLPFESWENKILYSILTVTKKGDFFNYNPSLFRDNLGRVLLLYRISNAVYNPTEDLLFSKQSIYSDLELSNKTKLQSLIGVDEIDLVNKTTKHLKNIISTSDTCGIISGYEDPRGFLYNNKNYCLCMEYRQNGKNKENCIPGVVLLDIDTEKSISLYHPLYPNIPQKNWLPFVYENELYITTDYNPHRIVKPDLETGLCSLIAETKNPDVSGDIRGSAGFIRIPGYYIGILHYRHGMDSYEHLLYAFRDSPPFNIVSITDKFCIQMDNISCNSVQMITGIYLENNIVHLTGGELDRLCYLISCPLGDIIRLLKLDLTLKHVDQTILPKDPDNNSTIPNTITSILILDDENLPPIQPYVSDCLQSWVNLNPEYKINVLDKNDCVDFLEKNFPKNVLKAFNKLKPYAYKVDLMRICWLYINGGVYKDFRMTLLKPLKEIVRPDIEFVFIKDLYHNQDIDYPILNSFIVSIPGHPVLKQYINDIVENVENNFYGKTELDPTGPTQFGISCRKILGGSGEWIPGVYDKYEILDHRNGTIIQDENIIIKTKPKNPEFLSDFKSGNNYPEMWKNKEIYN